MRAMLFTANMILSMALTGKKKMDRCLDKASSLVKEKALLTILYGICLLNVVLEVSIQLGGLS